MLDKKAIFKFCPLCKADLEVKDVNGANRLFCPSCSWINYQNPVPVAVAAVLNSRREVLITKRTFEPCAGQWSLPGGFVEVGEHPENACLRELSEGTGISGEIIGLAGIYSLKSRVHGSLLILGYEVKALTEKLKLNMEISEAAFFAHSDIPHITFTNHVKLLQDIFKK